MNKRFSTLCREAADQAMADMERKLAAEIWGDDDLFQPGPQTPDPQIATISRDMVKAKDYIAAPALPLSHFALRLGKTMAAIRNDLGLTQDQVGGAAGYSREHISSIETGRTLPTLTCLYAVAAVLGVGAIGKSMRMPVKERPQYLPAVTGVPAAPPAEGERDD